MADESSSNEIRDSLEAEGLQVPGDGFDDAALLSVTEWINRNAKKRRGPNLKIKIIRPSRGRPYTRCPECREQIFCDVTKQASMVQIAYVLHPIIARHKRERHG